jgi:ATP-dependent RNA helicase DDX51/DBP6
VLIFTKSNETAVRLGRLIALLEPKYAELTGTLTSTTRSSARASTIASFNSNKLSILVASDLVSRGLDLPDLAHVVNYDIPTSVTNYVHRVGRTARAGRQGHAWTLFTDTEGRWFWNEIARSASIQRPSGSKVERVNVTPEQVDGGLRKRYEAALEELGREATGSKPDVSKQT